MIFEDGTRKIHEDHWRHVTEDPEAEQRRPWKGTTVFMTSPNYEPEQETEDYEGKRPRAMSQPKEPSKEEKELHNLTHIPYRTRCQLCVAGKGKQAQYRRQDSKHPLVQVDYGFLTTKEGGETATILAAYDVTNGMSMTTLVEKKGVNKYALSELKRFLLETGRMNAVIQTDQENSIKTLVAALVKEVGGALAIRTSSSYAGSQAQGAIERHFGTCFGRCRTLKGQVEHNYDTKIDV